MNGPNQPCECGSGKKQKKCHPQGAPIYGPFLKPAPQKTTQGERKAYLSALAMLALRSAGR